MNLIDSTRISDFVRLFATKGGKYAYFTCLPHRMLAKFNDVYATCLNAYEVGIAFQTAAQAYKDWEYFGMISTISEKIFNYLNKPGTVDNNQLNFDKFHQELCDLFITTSSSYGKTYTYGNAQKYINMCFKYLTAHADYALYADLFSYCHMPIDSKILYDFEHRYGILNIRSGIRTGRYFAHYNGAAWTSFDKELYYSLVNDYRSALMSIKGNHSWLGIEYYIWAGIFAFPTVGMHAPLIEKFYM